MSGIYKSNYPAFHEAAKRLRERGFVVLNPAETDGGDTSGAWAYYLRKALAQVLQASAVAVLPGWRKSKGATLETHVAVALGMPIVDIDTLEPVSETILEEAQRLVHGDRNAAYGHPLDDMDRTGAIITAILGKRLAPGERVVAEDIPLFMQAVKISRECNRPKRDNRTDGAGYWECLEMIHEERARRRGEG